MNEQGKLYPREIEGTKPEYEPSRVELALSACLAGLRDTTAHEDQMLEDWSSSETPAEQVDRWRRHRLGGSDTWKQINKSKLDKIINQ